MNRLANVLPCLLVQVLLINAVNAQVLAEAQVLRKTIGVEQYGLKSEEHYIFCATKDCQERSAKHIRVAKEVDGIKTDITVTGKFVEMAKVPHPSVGLAPLFKAIDNQVPSCTVHTNEVKPALNPPQKRKKVAVKNCQ